MPTSNSSRALPTHLQLPDTDPPERDPSGVRRLSGGGRVNLEADKRRSTRGAGEPSVRIQVPKGGHLSSVEHNRVRLPLDPDLELVPLAGRQSRPQREQLI